MIKLNKNNNKIIPPDGSNSLVNNPPGEIFKLDDSKLLKLTGEMIQTGQVKTTLDFARNFMFTFDSKELFPININMLIDMKVYDRKDNCKSKLIKNFILDTEFKVQKATPESSGVAFDIQKVTLNKKGGSGLLKENIMLTIDCFKSRACYQIVK